MKRSKLLKLIAADLKSKGKIKVIRVRSENTGKFRNKTIDKKISNKEAREFREFLEGEDLLEEIKDKVDKKRPGTRKLNLKQKDQLFKQALQKDKELLRVLRTGAPQASAKSTRVTIKYAPKNKEAGGFLKFSVKNGKIERTITVKHKKADPHTGEPIVSINKRKIRKGNLGIDVNKLKKRQVLDYLDKKARGMGGRNYESLTPEQKREVQKQKNRWLENRRRRLEREFKRKYGED